MMIFHTYTNIDSGMKKDYKRRDIGKPSSFESVSEGRIIQSKVLKDKISKKNIKFLQGLGLKVKN